MPATLSTPLLTSTTCSGFGLRLRLNPRKCQLIRRETAFLGHVVSERGVANDPAKVTAVQDWPIPANVVPSIASLTSTSRSFGRRSAQKPLPDSEWLSRRPLAYPDVHRPFIVDTDASNVGVGAVLSQEDSDGACYSVPPRKQRQRRGLWLMNRRRGASLY
ncbi:hypothetical protein AAFF_G00245340 [Aldrovandia affinis]|uniref:Reverse transcriptase/retrotransposon-derived protein RNase H-like domain-containing protein n=1 Tax=Aldrovandia affinis TaxID=143900 RepID=A0AAD7W3K1_9TELE|nr:hypothetical protein AAFF_G00245340 [Aldrovandia affinis]